MKRELTARRLCMGCGERLTARMPLPSRPTEKLRPGAATQAVKLKTGKGKR